MRTDLMPPFFDVRMRGFRNRADVADVLALLDARVRPLPAERVPLHQLAGRVLAAAVDSPVDVPGFVRAAMDGYAVRAEDIDPRCPLAVIGDALPAKPFAGTIGPGQAVRVMTGAPVPAGADAVLMAEAADPDPANGGIRVREPVSPGRNVIRVGEDVAAGREVLPAGRVLRPQDVGLLAAIGVSAAEVVRRPRVAVLVTGDELLPPGSAPTGFRIVDSNSPMLAALVTRDGGECLPVQHLPDRYDAVRDALASTDADVILVSGGTSVGQEDHAPRALAELGELPVHGIALRPAAPTGIGFLGERRGLTPPSVVVLLPGNPVACLCGYDLLAGRAIRTLGGRPAALPYRTVTARLASKLVSAVGRVDYARLRLTPAGAEPIAVSGASILSTTVVADGFVLVDRDREGLAPGEEVTVHLYD